MRPGFHQPTLSTIRRVEQKIKRKKYFASRHQLFVSLDKRVMYPTITTILRYLEESNKIAFNNDGSITWVFKSFSKPKKRYQRRKSITKH
jgi:biopolymer transport protein ExbD